MSSSGGYQIIGGERRRSGACQCISNQRLCRADTTMRNYVMAMDRENNQVGWAPVNTDNCGSI